MKTYYVVSTSLGYTLAAKRAGESATEVAKDWISSRHWIDHPVLDRVLGMPDSAFWEDGENNKYRAVTVLAC